jgi:hypothetical protein
VKIPRIIFRILNFELLFLLIFVSLIFFCHNPTGMFNFVIFFWFSDWENKGSPYIRAYTVLRNKVTFPHHRPVHEDFTSVHRFYLSPWKICFLCMELCPSCFRGLKIWFESKACKTFLQSHIQVVVFWGQIWVVRWLMQNLATKLLQTADCWWK